MDLSDKGIDEALSCQVTGFAAFVVRRSPLKISMTIKETLAKNARSREVKPHESRILSDIARRDVRGNMRIVIDLNRGADLD